VTVSDTTQAAPETAAAAPANAATLYEFALTAAAIGDDKAAIAALWEVTQTAPRQVTPWRKLAEQLNIAGQYEAADAAEAAADSLGDGDPPWPPVQDKRPAAQFAIAEKRLSEELAGADPEEQIARLRALLLERHIAVAAMRLLATLEWQRGDRRTATNLLERVVARAVNYTAARADLASLLFQRHDYARALAEIDTVVAQAPNGPQHHALRAACHRALGDTEAAAAELEELRERKSRNPKVMFAYAEALARAGQRDEAAATYRACIAMSPAMGEAWWGLAALGDGALTAADIPAMRALLIITAMEPESRRLLLYALAHAQELAGDHAASFASYQQGAKLFVTGLGRLHDAAGGIARAARAGTVFSLENLAARPPLPAPDPGPAPIFLVGMPRSGLALTGRILGRHSHVEVLGELPAMDAVVRDLVQSRGLTRDDFPACVLDLSQKQRAALGADYLRRVAPHRRQGRPFFIDRFPWNWHNSGLISLILPQAKIIDVRRDRMAACFAMFRQVLPGSAEFSYDLGDLGHYYAAYEALMAHWDQVLPGQVHHLSYERLVTDSEAEIRALLAHCGLPFEPACLEEPIVPDHLETWRPFEPWLTPLKEALVQPVAG
jgi:tetratricopeptide (TPR) repeat protein